MGLLDFAFGETHKDIIEAAQLAHQQRYAARDQARRGRKMFHELAKEIKFRSEFAKDIKKKLANSAIKDHTAVNKQIGLLIEDLQNSLKDDVMLAHLLIQSLIELRHEDEGIEKQGFNRAAATQMIQECEKELESLKKVLYEYSTVLRRESTE